MARYLMLAFNGPTAGEGDAETLERWYEDVHLREFRAVAGVTSARRYKVLRGKMPGMEAWPYFAAYEIETDDLAALSQCFQTQIGPAHATLDASRSAHLMAMLVSDE